MRQGWLLALIAILLSVGCGLHRRAPTGGVEDDWLLKSTKHLAANELWKEHDGGDQIYLDRGCLSETMKDYRHRSRPWAIRCSIFEQKDAGGARALFEYYYEGIENEVRDVERIGDATYMWKSPVMHCWIIGFAKGKFFVEISLTEEGPADAPLTGEGRRALVDFARRVAADLR